MRTEDKELKAMIKELLIMEQQGEDISLIRNLLDELVEKSKRDKC